jgi:hypothetical protein
VPLLALCAATAGGLGAFVGTPAEVALIRMSADGKLPLEQVCCSVAAVRSVVIACRVVIACSVVIA